MPWNGSGQFNRDTGVFTGATVWDDSRVAGRTVRSDDHDTHDEDIATGLENTVTRDGQNSASDNLPMATFRHTGVGNAQARTDYAAAGQIQDQGLTHIAPASVGGTADAITLSPTPVIAAYGAGQRWSFVAEATNTGATTVDVSSLGTRAVQKLGAALVAGDITTGDMVVIEDDGTQFQMLTPTRTPVLAADLALNILDITDSNGNEVHSFAGTASAVNELTTTNAATGNAPELSATGDDTNIDVNITPAGNGATVLTTGALDEQKGADIASATTTDIGAATGNYVDITGTTTITGLGTIQAGTRRIVQFDGALTLTHNASSLILPGAANITTAAGDVAHFVSLGSGDWKCTAYIKQDGTSVVFSGITLDTEQATTSGTSVTFSGIPSTVKRITVMLDGVSGTSTGDLTVELGDAGGIETSGYISGASIGASAGALTNAFALTTLIAASNALYGQAVLHLEDATNNVWTLASSLTDGTGSNPIWLGAGRKALSGTLTQLRFGINAGTFDAGSVNMQYDT